MRKGYTLLECVIAMLIISLSLVLTSTIFNYLSKLAIPSNVNLQDEIGIYQLQIALANGDIVEVGDDYITYETLNNVYTISLVNNNLIGQPGTVMYLVDINNIEFYLEDDIYYLEYEREENEYKFPIALP